MDVMGSSTCSTRHWSPCCSAAVRCAASFAVCLARLALHKSRQLHFAVEGEAGLERQNLCAPNVLSSAAFSAGDELQLPQLGLKVHC